MSWIRDLHECGALGQVRVLDSEPNAYTVLATSADGAGRCTTLRFRGEGLGNLCGVEGAVSQLGERGAGGGVSAREVAVQTLRNHLQPHRRAPLLHLTQPSPLPPGDLAEPACPANDVHARVFNTHCSSA
jgi:hypothetical protein